MGGGKGFSHAVQGTQNILWYIVVKTQELEVLAIPKGGAKCFITF